MSSDPLSSWLPSASPPPPLSVVKGQVGMDGELILITYRSRWENLVGNPIENSDFLWRFLTDAEIDAIEPEHTAYVNELFDRAVKLKELKFRP